MADPFSIATGVVALLHVTGKVATELKKLHENAASVYGAIKDLQNEIHGLQTILESMRTVCEHITAERGSGHIGSLWDGVAQAVVDGKQGLEQFLGVIEEINKETKFLDDYRKQFRLTKSEEKIARCRTHVQACSQTLQICLLVIGLVNQNAHLSIAEVQVLPSLAELQEDVRRIAHRLDHAIRDPQPAVPTQQDKDHRASMKNLLGCVRSAASVISDTTTNRSAEPDSGVKRLPSNATSYILRHQNPALKRWLESRTICDGEDGVNFRAVAAPMSVADVPALGESDEDEDSDTEFEEELTRLLFNNGMQKLAAGDFLAAEKLFNSSLERTKRSRVENQRGAKMQVEILQALYTMYLDQQRLPQAEKTLRQKMAVRDRSVSTLSDEYLSDVLNLAELSRKQNETATAQLYARQALKGYRKLRSSIQMKLCLSLLIELCQIDGSESDLAAYETLLENLIVENPDKGLNTSSGKGVTRNVEDDYLQSSHLHQPAVPPAVEEAEEEVDGVSEHSHLSGSKLSYTTTAFERPELDLPLPDQFSADDVHTHGKRPNDDEDGIDRDDPGGSKVGASEPDGSHAGGVDSTHSQPDGYDAWSWAGSDNAESTLVSHSAESAASSSHTWLSGAQELARAAFTAIGLQPPTKSLHRPALPTFDLSEFDKYPEDEVPIPCLYGRRLRRTYAEQASMVEKEALHIALPAIVTHKEMFTTPELDDLALRMQEPSLYGLRFRRTYAEEEVNVGKEVLRISFSSRPGVRIYAEQEPNVEKECLGIVPSISLNKPQGNLDSRPSAASLRTERPSVRSAFLALLHSGTESRHLKPIEMPVGTPHTRSISLSHDRDGIHQEQAFNVEADIPSFSPEVVTSAQKLRTSMSSLEKRLGLNEESKSDTEAFIAASPDQENGHSTFQGPLSRFSPLPSLADVTAVVTFPPNNSEMQGNATEDISSSGPLARLESFSEEAFSVRLASEATPSTTSIAPDRNSGIGDGVIERSGGGKTLIPPSRSLQGSPGAALRKRRPSIRRKLVMVGDSMTGKTKLAKIYAYGSSPVESDPTVSESYTIDMEVDDKQVELALWDTGGRTEYDRLRPISYSGAHAVLLCFAIDDPDSLDNVAAKWSPEAQRYGRHVPTILVGTKVDLRWDQETGARLQKLQQFPVSRHQGEQLQRRIGALEYIECSAATGEGVQTVFERSIRAAASLVKERRRRNLWGIF